MRAAWFVLLVGVACGAPPARVPSPHPPTMADARAAARGDGQRRDFTKAAEIESALCADGGGSLDACVALVDAIEAGRGVDRDPRRQLALLDAMCQRGDAASCAQSAMLWMMLVARAPKSTLPPDAAAKAANVESAMANAERACDRGDGRSCELLAGVSSIWQSGPMPPDVEAKFGVACRQSRYEACLYLTVEMQACDDDHARISACEQRVIAGWRSGSDGSADVHATAATTLIDACRAGDAAACEYVPSMHVPVAALCAAHDWHACMELGCLGDDAAGSAASVHGVEGRDCNAALNRANTDWARTPPASRSRFPPVAADARRPIGARSTPPFEAVHFQHHGGRDHHDWPRFDAYNLGDRPVRELELCLYAYRATRVPPPDHDTSVQLARVMATVPLALAPDALAPLALDNAIGGALPDGTTDVAIDYDRVEFADGSGSADTARCPDQRPFDQRSPDAW